MPIEGPPGAVAGSADAPGPAAADGARVVPTASAGAKRPVRLVGAHFVVGARRTTDAATPRLMMAIPKKLVPSSPVRNLVRRVIRESHRAACVRHRLALEALSVKVQLVKVPQDPATPALDPRGRARRPFARRPADGALKRAVRAEVDGLIARLLPRAA